MDPIIGGALIGAGASFLGNMFNSSSQSDANETNLQIARENNDWSEKMMQKQMDYNTMMWERNNAYNSASAQRQRLEAAGLNPYMMMNGGNAGVAQSSGSVGLPSPTQPNIQAPKFDFSQIGDLLQNAQRIKNETNTTESQNRLLDLQGDYYAAQAMANLSKTIAETKNTTARTYFQNVQNSMAKEMLNQDYISKLRQNENLVVQTQNAIKTGILMSKEIAAFDEKNRAQIANICADTALKLATKQLTLRQAKTEFFKQAESSLRATNTRINNELLNKTFDFLVAKAYGDVYRGFKPFDTGYMWMMNGINRISK